MVNARRCRTVGWLPYFWLGGVGLTTLIGSTMLVLVIAAGETDAAPLLFSAAWLGIMGWCCYVGLVRTAYEIRLDTSGQLEFKSVLKRKGMDSADLVSIGPEKGKDPYILVFRSRTSSARALRMMEGMHDLVQELRTINPALKLRAL